VRNFQGSPSFRLRWLCDLDQDRARKVLGGYSTVEATDDYARVLADPEVAAVAIATPAATHRDLALAALEAGKHVLIEKPLAATYADGRVLVEEAARRSLTLMCDHTYCYTPAVRKLRELVAEGTVGDIQYVDSVRINLGLVQPDIDVFWDLAPHDLSILDFVLGETFAPQAVAAHGADPIGAGKSCVGYLTLPFRSAIAHIHVNWLSPTKTRTMIVAGSRRVVVWDDLHPSQRLSMYDRGVELGQGLTNGARKEAVLRELMVSYRVGEMVAPVLKEAEALRGVVQEFTSAIREGRPPLTGGEAGLRVLRWLEAASHSLDRKGVLVPMEVF